MRILGTIIRTLIVDERRKRRERQKDLGRQLLCEQFYAPGIYFRSLLIGYFEGIDSERGVAWRLGDSLSLRRFLAIEL